MTHVCQNWWRGRQAKGGRDHANGGPNRKVSQDASMNLKQLSIEITEMSGMGVK